MPTPTTTSTTSTVSTRSPTSSHSRLVIPILTCAGNPVDRPECTGSRSSGRHPLQQVFDTVPLRRRQHLGRSPARLDVRRVALVWWMPGRISVKLTLTHDHSKRRRRRRAARTTPVPSLLGCAATFDSWVGHPLSPPLQPDLRRRTHHHSTEKHDRHCQRPFGHAGARAHRPRMSECPADDNQSRRRSGRIPLGPARPSAMPPAEHGRYAAIARSNAMVATMSPRSPRAGPPAIHDNSFRSEFAGISRAR